jgi:hypothetical protein
LPELDDVLFRSYFELMESIHPGPYRKFDADVRALLDSNIDRIGRDEHKCEICGVVNVNPDGSGRRFFWGHGERYFCEQHKSEFEATFA